MRKYNHYCYYVLEIKLDGYYNYYLGKQGYGDLMHMYGVKDQLFPNVHLIESYVRTASKLKFFN